MDSLFEIWSWISFPLANEMMNALGVETIYQLYLKHKILKQICIIYMKIEYIVYFRIWLCSGEVPTLTSLLFTSQRLWNWYELNIYRFASKLLKFSFESLNNNWK